MDVPPRKLPPKKEVMIALLSESNVFVHLDPRRPGVIVPKWLQNAPELTLQLGLNMPIPIPDLEVEEDGISCTLSFNRAPFWCKLPWTAVFAIVSEKDRRGVVWPDDVPPESQLSNGGQKAPPPKARPKLTALGPNDRLEEREESPTSDVSETPASGNRGDDEERTPPPDAKCAECSTRWPEEQSTCPVCGATQWVGTGAPAAIPPPAPPITRPTLVENNDPNAKKRSAARPRGKATARTPSPRVVGSRKRTRPELVSEPSGSLSEARLSEARGTGARTPSPSGKGASKDSADASTPNPTLALFPPPPREETSAPPSPPKPTAAGERETIDTQTVDTPEETGNKKPSKRPLPPYLRVVK